VKLFEVPSNTWVRSIEPLSVQDPFYFCHIDGMYSYCLDTSGAVNHYFANMEVEIANPPEDCSDGMS
jgi:hypothetical protein